MTRVKIRSGACGFVTKVQAVEEQKRTVCVDVESDCEAVCRLGVTLNQNGPIGLKEVMTTNPEKNRILQSAARTLPHSACPVAVGILKAAEVALGLNVPSSVTIAFEAEGRDED